MSNLSPAAILFSVDGYEASVKNASAITAGTPAYISAGSDGTNSRYITVDTSGRQVVVGPGTAGSPVGGVLTVQGDASGQALPVTGTVTANIGTTNGLALDATLAKLTISTGTALGTNTVAMMGGSVTTAAPSYTTGQINALSLTTGGLLRVDGSAVTQPVSGTITANIGTTNGLALDATLAKLTIAQGASLGSNTQALMGGSVTTAAPSYTTGQISPLSLTTGGLLRVDGSAGTFPTTTVKSTTSTLSNVASSATSVTLLASNSNRLGATIYNDSTKKLYVKLGATASLTSFTIVLFSQGYYEVPFNYDGVVDGIWDSVNGAARVSELLA